ncbi:MAG: HAMP domain-containing sensor histidine kinase [Caldimonas sp.]
MTSSQSAGKLWPLSPRPQIDRTITLVVVLAIVIALAEVALDLATPLELDLASMFAVPLLLAAYTRRPAVLWSLSLLLGTAALVVYGLHIETVMPALKDETLINRLLDVVALLITTGVLHVWMHSLDVRESQFRLLTEQNRRLETANQMLVEHEAQILRQNEELDQRHKEAVASSARTSRLLIAVSHDIRTPIQTIGLVAELLRRTGENPGLAARVPQMVRQLQANAGTLVSMVTDLLDLARFDSGRIDLKESTFALDELVAAKCRELGALAETKALSLVAHTPPGPLWVRSDRVKVDRVLANLLGNAIKFTAHGSVTVSLAVSAPGSPVLQVTDTGRGIEPDALDRIFDEYAQAGNTDRAAESGWGLGLAISRRLAKALGATIDVSSVLGQGSTFTLTLPDNCVVDIAPLELPAFAAGRLAS